MLYVLEEIFNAAEALWFSPSGSHLAVASFNDTNVESAIYPVYGNPSNINDQYPELVKFKYPKVGAVMFILFSNLSLRHFLNHSVKRRRSKYYFVRQVASILW